MLHITNNEKSYKTQKQNIRQTWFLPEISKFNKPAKRDHWVVTLEQG